MAIVGQGWGLGDGRKVVDVCVGEKLFPGTLFLLI